MSLNIRMNLPSRPHHGGFRRRPPMMRSDWRAHNHHPRSVVAISLKTSSFAVMSILGGVAALIASLAPIILGALTFNPAAIGVGICLGALGVGLIVSGSAYLGLNRK